MINIQDKAKCCGCSACQAICPKQCVELKEDDEGFFYPNVDKSSCINCHLCEKVCPIANCERSKTEVNDAYVAQNIDEQQLQVGTSGSFIMPMIRHFLSNGGYVFAVTYDRNLNVVGKLFNSDSKQEELDRIYGSKYVQCDPKDCFRTVLQLTNEKKNVLFIGTPCQVSGIFRLVKNKEYLYTVDFVCHGVPSHILWDKYLEYMNTTYSSSVVDARFRYKQYGYYGSSMKVTFKNGESHTGSQRTDYMLKCFYGDIALRPSCYQCPFKLGYRSSDITVFDSWNTEKLTQGDKHFVDNKGYTNVLVNSARGKQLFEKVKGNYKYKQVDRDESIKLDGKMLYATPAMNPHRDEFYKMLSKTSLDETVKKLIPVTLSDHIRELAKNTYLKLGLTERLRK